MRLGVVTDVHLAPLPHARGRWHNDFDFAGAGRRLRRGLEMLSERKADAIIALGDLTESGDPDSLDEGLRLLRQTGLPTLVVPGNHDCAQSPDALADAVVRSGGGVAVAGASGDRVNGLTMAGVSLTRPPRGRGFVVRDLPRLADGLVLLSHYPVLSRRGPVTAAGYKYSGDVLNRDWLADHVQEDSAAVVAISGHLHVRDAVPHGRLLQLVLPAMIEPPYACGLIELGGRPLSVSYESIAIDPTPNGLDVPLFIPERASWVLGEDGWSAADGCNGTPSGTCSRG